MGKPRGKPANGFVAVARKVYNPLGFSKGYNFVFWFITMGYLFGFTAARFQYFSYNGRFCNPLVHGANGAAPGECYYYLMDPFKTGMKIHLYTILPAAFLVVFQFTPVIRHAAILVHRINGYLVIILSLISSAGALIVTQHAFGGDMSTRTYVGALVITTTLGYLMAYINIKLLQIDQHRAWMMRTWAYFSTIITLRIIMFSSAAIISGMSAWYVARPCAQINSLFGPHRTEALWPDCRAYFNGSNIDQHVVVTATMNNNNPMSIGAALGVTFGSAGWLAFWLHAILIEVYLRMTPRESERLRQVSYERQVARGFKHPGYAGLVAERFGDANPYVPDGGKHHVLNEGEGVNMLPIPYQDEETASGGHH